MKKHTKKKIATMLSMTMFLTSLNLTNTFAKVVTDGTLEEENYLITLNAGEKVKFNSPSIYITSTEDNSSNITEATPSNVKRSIKTVKGAIKKSDLPTNTTVFAIENNNILSLENIEYAANEANLQIPEDCNILWSREPGNLDKIVTSEDSIKIYKSEEFYAIYNMKANLDECTALEHDSVYSYSPRGIDNRVLKIKDLEGEHKIENRTDLEKTIKEAGEDYAGLDYDSLIQIDVSPSIDDYIGGIFEINMIIPERFINEIENGKEIFGLYREDNKNYGKWNILNIQKLKSQDNIIEFSITNSPQIILGLRDSTNKSDEKDTVNVTLKKSKGGSYIVYMIDDDGMIKYIPIDKTVSIPSGTELHMYTSYNTKHKPYNCDVYIYEEKTKNKFNFAGTYILDSEKGDIEIISNAELMDKDDPEYGIEYIEAIIKPDTYCNSPNIKGKLYIKRSVNETISILKGRDWKFEDNSDEDIDNYLFTLDKDGNISSKDELDARTYKISVSCLTSVNNRIQLYGYINAGNVVEFYLGLCKCFRSEDGYFGPFIGSSVYFGEKNFSEILNDASIEENYGVLGDFEIKCWYDKNGKIITGKLNSPYTDVYALCVDNKTGKVYAPVFYYLDDKEQVSEKPNIPEKPNDSNVSLNPDTNKNPSSSSSSSSSDSSSGFYDPSVLNGSWKSSAEGWRLLLKNGGYAKDTWGIVDGAWYYFGSDTYMKTGWLYWNDNWYYLNPESDGKKGQMKTGWVFDKALGNWFNLDPSGKMKTGWQLIDGKWYYFNPNSDGTKGVMMVNSWIGNYYVNTNGVWDPNKRK